MLLCAFVVAGLTIGFVLGTFGEYWVHRAMHRGVILARRHGDHHREGQGQGALKEFRDYASGALAVAVLFLPVDHYLLTGGALAGGAVCGVLIHAMFAAWCHQAQHEDPRLLPWLARTPVHFVHHELAQARHNFGISVDWWDRLFGTYKPEPGWRLLLDPDSPPRPWWRLDWLDHRATVRNRPADAAKYPR